MPGSFIALEAAAAAQSNGEWELRNRLPRSAARMHAAQLDPMVDDLRALPDKIGVPIPTAWKTCWTCSLWRVPAHHAASSPTR